MSGRVMQETGEEAHLRLCPLPEPLVPAVPQVEEPAVAPSVQWPIGRPETVGTIAAAAASAAASSVAVAPYPGWMPSHP